MLADIVFLGTSLCFLILPVLFYLVYRYSLSLEESLAAKTENQKKFNKTNSTFHFFFRLAIIVSVVLAIVQLAAVLYFNHDLVALNNLIFIDFQFFTFITVQIIFFVTIVAVSFFTLLYFRFKPGYKHHFLQKLLRIITAIVFVFSTVSFIFYQYLQGSLALPQLFNYQTHGSGNLILQMQWYVYSPLILLVFFYTYAYRRFSRRRTQVTSRIYLLVYLLVLFLLLILSVNSGIRYFDLFTFSAQKQNLFHFSTAYAGVFWTYLFTLSICSIIFSIFIFLKKDKFIGSQFAISYTLKLAHLNFYSTLLLSLLTLMPWIMLEFYKHF